MLLDFSITSLPAQINQSASQSNTVPSEESNSALPALENSNSPSQEQGGSIEASSTTQPGTVFENRNKAYSQHLEELKRYQDAAALGSSKPFFTSKSRWNSSVDNFPLDNGYDSDESDHDSDDGEYGDGADVTAVPLNSLGFDHFGSEEQAYVRLAFPCVLSRKSGLSNRVMTLLHVANQHKMGPTGARALLLEAHTKRFNTCQLMYLEAIFEREQGAECNDVVGNQPTLYYFRSAEKMAEFGSFDDINGYGGFVPSCSYLITMLNRDIERDEVSANQHTALLPFKTGHVDDSHKIVKCLSNGSGVHTFNGLWTLMSGWFIRKQVLTFTKSHLERQGPMHSLADSLSLYGYAEPQLWFSDVPDKDKSLIEDAFPKIAEGLHPMAEAQGLKSLTIPEDFQIQVVDNPSIVNTILCPKLIELHDNATSSLHYHFDAEWNRSCSLGVSVIVLLEHENNQVYIFRLPESLARLLLHPQVFFIGSNIASDFGRLKRQFSTLANHQFRNLINLKSLAKDRGLILWDESGALAYLMKKLLSIHLPKEDYSRICERWELPFLEDDLRQYAAHDVYASQCLYQHISATCPPLQVDTSCAPGTKVAIHINEGGPIAAIGQISNSQSGKIHGVAIKTPAQTRLAVDIETVILPDACSLLHFPDSAPPSRVKTGTRGLTLRQLRGEHADANGIFQIVAHVKQVTFYNNELVLPSPAHSIAWEPSALIPEQNQQSGSDGDEDELTEEVPALLENNLDNDSNANSVAQLMGDHAKAQTASNCPDPSDPQTIKPFLTELARLIESAPSLSESELYTRIKKDLFHAFHMIEVPANHGLKSTFSRIMRDHILSWDPVICERIDKVCREKLSTTFEGMLARNPKWIQRRCPRYVPPPSVLVTVLQYVFQVFGHAKDAKTGVPLFNERAWQKANAVLDLARNGYLSDSREIGLYEPSGSDQYGLELFGCIWGSGTVRQCIVDFMVIFHQSIGLALPVIPPSTSQVRKYFFEKLPKYALQASQEGKSRIDWTKFAQDWNSEADGTFHFYVTVEILEAYAKNWDKITNQHASQELITEHLTILKQTSQIFSGPNQDFPAQITSASFPLIVQPSRGEIEIDLGPQIDDSQRVPQSLSTSLSVSQPNLAQTFLAEGSSSRNTEQNGADSHLHSAENEVDDSDHLNGHAPQQKNPSPADDVKVRSAREAVISRCVLNLVSLHASIVAASIFKYARVWIRGADVLTIFNLLVQCLD
ncbi:hypothetical protein GYMLUDRAFT_251766 [Collybiopsis luxurians FD-317 M1]|uniref:3'-5' exonuclease n=1 Tax=Collybiopsis luxurians FD-317 M1 TaxID=944289 RepID=A0A0D0BQ90_9AGAR|nr:hypothetical protein GYMLUDRAFT_251766 [Collybiopsis luxurians FD-317 M1]